MTAKPKDTDERGGRHRKGAGTPWIQSVAGQIEHAEPGAEAPHRLGFRGREPRHQARGEGKGGGR